MAQLPNPNSDQPYDRVIKGPDGAPRYGIRDESTPREEIVDLRTNQSNHTYWQPEMVMNPEGCDHTFQITDIGAREVECTQCRFPTTLHLGINTTEVDGKISLKFKGKSYPVSW